MEGQILGSYKVLSRLGEGGMGTVYLGEHQVIGRKAAIKTLLPQFTNNHELVDRFFNEARAATSIHHPGIVEVYDFGTLADGTAFMVMEFLQGEALEDRLKRLGRFPIKEAAVVARHIASALAAAHNVGIVHRDLKPDNVFLVPDPDIEGGERVKILDFGIAKLAENQVREGSMRTRTGMVMGTPSYMSPEQCRGAGEVDARADIYSLGCVLFHLLCGRPPFVMEGLGEILGAHQHVVPPLAASLEPSIPEALNGFIARTLAKDPAERPQTMDEVVATLSTYASLRPGIVDARTVAAVVMPPTSPPATPPATAVAAQPATAVAAQPATAVAAQPATAVAAQPQPQTPRATAVVAEPPPDATHRIKKAGTKRWGIIAAVAAVAVVGGGAIALLSRSAHSAAEPAAPTETADTAAPAAGPATADPAPPPSPTPAAVAKPAPVNVPAGMAPIRATSFRMGSSDEEVDAAFSYCKTLAGDQCRRDLYEREQPARQVSVSAFFIDRREVTNQDFAAWLSGTDGVRVDGKGWVTAGETKLARLDPAGGIEKAGKAFAARSGDARKPVVFVTWFGARSYCQSRGGELPTEAQWELAARGSEHRTFPWGAKLPECDAVVFGRFQGGPCHAEGLADVGSASGDVTPNRVHDLGGNAAEWTLDRFEPSYQPCGDCKDPVVAATPTAKEPVVRSIRGGYAQGLGEALRAAGRSRQPDDSALSNVGFRCAQGADAK